MDSNDFSLLFDSSFSNNFASILNLTNNIIILLDLQLNIIFINKEAEAFYTWQYQEVTNKNYTVLCQTEGFTSPLPDNLNPILNGKDYIHTPNLAGVEHFNLTWHIQRLTDNLDTPKGFVVIGKYNFHQQPKNSEAKALRNAASIEKIAVIEQIKRLTGQDIDSSENVYSLLKKVQSYYENLIAHMPGNVYWLDRNCVTLGCNDNVVKLVGLQSRQEFIGITYEKMGELAGWTEGQAQSFKKDDMEVMTSGAAKFSVEEPPLYDQQGNPVYYLSNRVPLRDSNNNIIGVVGISIDITKEKQIRQQLEKAKEEAEAANQIKSEFIANMSHDLRTPLTGILGMAEIIEEQTNDDAIKESARQLMQASHVLLNLLNDIIEITKASSNEIPTLSKKFSLNIIVDNIYDLSLPSAKHKGLTIKLNYDRNIPEYLIGDPTKINRIILNIVGNAIKFTQQGDIKIRVKLLKQDEHQATVKIIVEDTGIGIPKDKQEIIFSRFTRLQPSYKGVYKGSGLGLTIAKQFMEEIGGKIYVRSELGKGSRFSCVIPLSLVHLKDTKKQLTTLKKESLGSISPSANIQSPTIESSQKSSVQDSPDKTSNSYQVLLVEDDNLAQTVAKQKLSAQGCNIEVASTGNEALKLAKNKRYDLIFMDIGLPDISGIEVTRKIRGKKEHINYHTPIIALTAHLDEKDVALHNEAGINSVLVKPLMKETAKQIIDSLAQGTMPAHPNCSQTVTSLTDNKVIDLQQSIKYMGNETTAREMLTILVDSLLPTEMQKINSCYKNNDLGNMLKAVHKLHGGVSYCGVPKLKKAVKQLEEALKLNQDSKLQELYNILINEIDTVIEVYKEYFKT